MNGFALEPAEAMPLLQEFNQRCEPPWTDAELQHKLEGVKPSDNRGYLLGNGKPKTDGNSNGAANTFAMPTETNGHATAGRDNLSPESIRRQTQSGA